MRYTQNIGPALGKFVGGINKPIVKVAQSGLNEPLLRMLVGILGVALPIVLLVWKLFIDGSLPDSISASYAYRTRDALVGFLFVIGWILFAYKGYEKMDSIAGKLACIFALGVALFPCTAEGWQPKVHYTCATCMFAILAFFSIFLFTKTRTSPEGFWPTVKSFRLRAERKGETLEREKRNRNKLYIACGIIILVCMVMIPIYNIFWQHTVLANIKPVFWLETFIIWAFGLAWFVKGKAK